MRKLAAMRRPIAIVTLFVLIPNPSLANAGIPLIAVFLPPLWLALPLVIVVEGIVLSRSLDVSFWRAMPSVAVGNIASTIGGIPLLWIVLVLMQVLLPPIGVPFPAIAWLIPYEHDLWWMLPAALVVFAFPCFLVSIAIEAPINRLGLSNLRSKLIWRATLVANAYSYSLLALLIGVLFAFKTHLEWADFIMSPALDWFGDLLFNIIRAVRPSA